jgi:phosphoglycolate phosphatase
MEAAIFDLDGTLVDSLEDIACALDLALDDHGLARPTRGLVRTWIGGGARNLIAQAVPLDMIDPVYARFRVHYEATPIKHTRLYDGIAGVLDRFAEAGVKLAVCSNKPDPLTQCICDVVLARWPFGAIVGQRSHVALKPAPDSALEVAERLGTAPEACTFVGDSAIDILTAQAAKMRAVGVSWGFRPRTELAAANASLIADAPADLLTLLESRASRSTP